MPKRPRKCAVYTESDDSEPYDRPTSAGNVTGTYSTDIHEDRMKSLTWLGYTDSLKNAGSARASSVPDGDVQAALDVLLRNLSIPDISSAPTTEHLDAKISAITNGVTALLHASVSRVMHLRRERNSQASINRLPPEVLNEILARVVEKEESYAPVVNLMKVCRQWHDLILDTPTFWNYISDRYDRDVVAMLLKRSMSTPLRVRYKEEYIDDEDSALIAENMGYSYSPTYRFPPVLEVLHHLSRLEHVELDLYFTEKLNLETPAPVLRSFNLSLQPSTKGEAEINLFDGHAPQLESLSISGWTLPWTSPVFNRLITLHISRIEANPPSLGNLILILKASPVLFDFQLSHTTVVASDRESLQSPIGATTLLHLETWITTEVDINTMELLLEHFEMPAVSTVCLGLPLGAEWEDVPAPGSSIQRLFDSILEGNGDLGLEVGRARFKLWSKAGMTLLFSLTRESSEMYLSWVVACYGSSLTNRITSFTCNSEMIDSNTVIRMLSTMERLEELRLESYGNLDAVLEYLKKPSFTSSVGVWPLPQLHYVYVDDCRWSTPNAFLTALQWRYGIVLTNIVGLDVILPDRLTSFNKSGMVPSDVELRKIRTLVNNEYLTASEEDLKSVRQGFIIDDHEDDE